MITNEEYLFQKTKINFFKKNAWWKVWNRGPFITSFSKVLQNSLNVICCDQTTETSTLPAICIFKRSNPILLLIFQNSGIFISFVTSLSPNWVKRVQSCISCHISRVIEKSKSILDGTLKWRVCFWDYFLKILQFWLPLVTSLTQNWLKKGSKLVSHVLMVIKRWKSKEELRNLKILALCCDVIISELGHKDSNLYIICNWRQKY